MIKIIPNSSKNEILKMENGFLKIKIKEPAQKNLANKELISFLSKTLKTKKSNIKIKGKIYRKKTIFLENLNEKSANILKIYIS